MKNFGAAKVRVILHVFPLTMHRQAWDAAQVRYLLDQLITSRMFSVLRTFLTLSASVTLQTAAIVSQERTTTPSSLFDFFDYFWINQPAFSQAAFYGKTQADLYSLFSLYALKHGVSNSTFYSKMGSDPIFNMAYNGVEMGADRHIYSTPTFYINGIRSTFDEKTTYSTWVSFISSLLSQ